MKPGVLVTQSVFEYSVGYDQVVYSTEAADTRH